ncbi:MAG: amidohydrolase family protein [Ilumatobacter sp.]|nr:amidohydrolase family protein [Ilumatobacter sp.]
MADGDELLRDGAVVVDGDRIVAVTGSSDARERFAPTHTLGGSDSIVLPGLVNAHQHLTGDRLLRSTIPDDLDLDRALREWALPSHAAHTGDLDELSATLALVEAVTNGVTFTVEAGTVAHPDRVLAAFDAVGVGGTLGTWGWDVDGGVHAGTVDEVLDRQRTALQLTADHDRVDGWVTLVGHDLMSDELVVGAAELADEHGTGLTFHMSPSDADARSYLRRTGRRPLDHLHELGVLGPDVLVAHAVHIDDHEIDVLLHTDTAVASCPWAYLRLGQGVTRSFHHPRLLRHGGRVALGCDSENAGDVVDVFLAARLFAGLAKDAGAEPSIASAGRALRLATIDGARAIGMGHEIGSLEVGKRADLVAVDTTGPAWTPQANDPTTALVWASDGRAVRDVVASGRVVVADGGCTTVDHRALAADASAAHRLLVSLTGDPDRPAS